MIWYLWFTLKGFERRRKWQPTPVFLPGESHGQRSLAGYSSWGYKSQTQLKRLNHQRKTTLDLAASDNGP